MSLADELVADFDDVDDENEPDNVQNSLETQEKAKDVKNETKSIYNTATLLGNEKTKNILFKIENFEKKENINYEAEYDLIVEANTLIADIDTEIVIVHKFVKDIYNKRLLELESLVTAPYDYIQTVNFLGNHFDPSKIENIDFLPPAIKMVVTVTVSTDQGEKLSDAEMQAVNEACQMGFDLAAAKIKVMGFVQSKMSFIAPNLCKLLGANKAAEIVGAAGGLTELSKMPACNILILGSQKRSLAGFASTSVLPHAGYIFFCPLVQRLPPQFRKKAARVLSAKIALTVRIDGNHEYTNGSFGDKMLEEIQNKYDKWMAPPPVKMIKALPRPDDSQKKKRGGKRQRSMKQKYALTELGKQAKRIHFGIIQEDVYQTAIGFGVNALGQQGSGKVRVAPVDKKTKISISKRLQKNLASMGSSTFGTKTSIRSSVSGMASSVAFTPMAGIEIINPNIGNQNAQPDKDSLKYFSSKSGFQSSKNLPNL